MAQSARDLLKAERFDEARESLEAGLKNWPDDSGLKRLLDAGTEMQAAYQRVTAVAEALKIAQDLRQKGNLEDALKHIRDAISRHGEDSALSDFGRRLEFEYEQQQYGASLRDAVEQGRRLLTEGKAADTVAFLEQAAVRFPHEALIATLLASAVRTKAAQEQQEFVRERLDHVQNRVR